MLEFRDRFFDEASDAGKIRERKCIDDYGFHRSRFDPSFSFSFHSLMLLRIESIG